MTVRNSQTKNSAINMYSSGLSGPKARILAAESDDLCAALERVAANGGAVQVTLIRDGVEAMHTLLGSSCDLVIIDLALPSLDGLRLIALIRATPQLRRLPILAVARALEPDGTLESIKAGADDYLARPIEWPLLAMRIRQLTRQQQPS